MNIETKRVRGDYHNYLNFGWKFTEDTSVRVGNHHRTEHVLARDKDMPKYQTIVAYENKYFTLKNRIKPHEEISPGTAIILLLLLIIPGVIYLIAKTNKNDEIDRANKEIRAQMNKILVDVNRVK